jgi:tyrosyl-tRNA synthetase
VLGGYAGKLLFVDTENRPILIHEFLYPLVQGYDSVAVRADVEIGGTDQKFNLLVGRELMREAGMEPQCILTLPLLVGLDGVNKMSKSLGNYIGISESADEIFGKAMSVPDAMMRDYLVLTLCHPESEADALLREVSEGRMHPRDLKARIAFELAARYRGESEAQAARERFDRIFRQREAPEEVGEAVLEAGPEGKIWVVKVIVAAGLVASNREARKLIDQGGVSLDGEKLTNPDLDLVPGEYLVKVGKRHFKRIKLT